jgi:mannose-6-phosphate isomerase-like protein (cupin superfamily)
MVSVYTPPDWSELTLPGRRSWDIVSSRTGSRAVTMRYVEIPPEDTPGQRRTKHKHLGREEVIWVLSGQGVVEGLDSETPVSEGQVIYVPADEPHRTRNAGQDTLRLLCFFPEAEIGRYTQEPA